MEWEIKKSDSIENRKLWAAMDAAAQNSPKWMREQVNLAVSERVTKSKASEKDKETAPVKAD